MVNELLRSVKSFRAAKQEIAARERQLIDDLNRVLPEIGYRVVPAAREPEEAPSGPAETGPDARTASHGHGRKPLGCPHCDRRFARPLHLGRHMAATHSRRKRAA